MKKCLLSVIVALAAAVSVQSAPKNYVYLFDCTASMKDNRIWDNALRSLDNTLAARSGEDDAVVTILPFQDNVLGRIRFAGNSYGEEQRKFNNGEFNRFITQKHKWTNIIDALDKSGKELNPNAANRIYLFTDGDDSHVGAKGVAEALARWCDSHKNSQLFYIMLNESVDDDKIMQVASVCDEIHVVKTAAGDPIPIFADVDGPLFTGILDLERPLKLRFSESGSVPVRITCDNPYFEVTAADGKSSGGMITVGIRPRGGLERVHQALDTLVGNGDYEFMFRVESLDSGIRIVNPDVKMVVANKVQRIVEILGADFSETEKKPGAEWYDSFLFWSADTPDTLRIDLDPRFNEGAVADGVKVDLSLDPANGQPRDFIVLFNGKECRDGEFAVEPGKPAELGIVFNSGARQGKRYFEINPVDATQFDMLNGVQAQAIETGVPVKTSYDESWNPMKTILVWAGIVAAVLLALWFLIGRRQVYPVVKAKKLVFTAPYKTVMVKGARQVVLTSKRTRQGVFSRIFTGKIVYWRDPMWTSDLVFKPRRKGMRFVGTQGWNVTPTATIDRQKPYELNSPDKKKYPFSLN